MTTITIFFAAFFASILFLLCMCFKILSSVLEGGTTAVSRTLKMAGIGILILLLVYYCNLLVCGYMTSSLGEVIKNTILVVVAMCFLLWLLCVVCNEAWLIIVCLVIVFFDRSAIILEKASSTCENGYIYFLNVISKKIDRC